MNAIFPIKKCVNCTHWMKIRGRADAPGRCLSPDAPFDAFRTGAKNLCKLNQGRAFTIAKFLTPAQCFPGLIVITPMGALAQVTARVGDASVSLKFLFADEQGNEMLCKMLRAYVGPNVEFAGVDFKTVVFDNG